MRKTAIVLFFLLFFSLFTICFLSDNVKATIGDVTLTNWDDVATGLDSGTSGYFDFKNMGFANYFETSTDGDLSAPNSFKVSGIGTDKGTGYWNLTSDFSYIGSINFSFYLSTLGIGRRIDMMFNDSSGNRLLYMYWSQIGNAFAWLDVSSGWHNIYTPSLGTRYYCVITHNGTNQFNIKVLSSAFAVLANADYAGSYASDWSNFSYVYLYGYSTAVGNVAGYFDNIKINTLPSGGGTPPVDLGTLNTLGGYPSVINWKTVTTPTVEFRYDLPFTGKIDAFDFFVAKTTGNIADYYLSINGCPNIVATEIGTYDPTPDTPSSYLYYIRWDFRTSPVTLSNADNILMELYALNKPASPWDTGYWFPNEISSLYYAHGDIDGDGEQTHKTNSNLPNNVYYGNTYYSDLAYLLYYEGSGSVPVSPPTAYNTLNIYGSSIANTSGNPLFKQNDSVYIEYSISDVVLPSYIRLYEHDNPTEYTEQIFPFHILPEKNKGTIGYIADTIGNFNISLFVNGVNVLTRYIDVVINTDIEDTNFEVYTIPPITDNYAPYDVYYNYFSTSYDGYLMVFDSGSGIPLDLYNGEFASYFITHNTTGTIHFSHSHKENNHYWKLFVYINGAYYQKGSTHMHLINNQMVNSLSVSVNAGYEGVLAVAKISYTHTLLGSDVVLYINNNSWRNVGSLSYNIETYPVTKAGSYQVDMYLVENNGSRIKLCPSATFKVAGETPIDDTPDEILTFIDTLPLYVKIISSLVIIVVMTLIPMLVSVALSRENISINIPSLVYVAFFFLGMITTVLIGLLEIWIFGIVLFGLILAFAILWVQKKSEGG